MVLNKYREKADPVISPIAEKLKVVNPNVISWSSLIFALLAGISFYLSYKPLYVLSGGIFVFLNSLLDALDGKIAKITGKDSKRGDFLDHTIDRYSDIFILLGIILGPLCRTWVGIFAVIGVLMTSYMGTQADAVGVSRDYGGIAGRAERLVLLIVFSFLYFLLFETGWTSVELMDIELGLFELLMIWFALAGNLTAVFRGINSWSDLSEE
ncbi:MAG: CDP-alcohol phosphatidyltransferase family protein [Candidatus Thermoplasmatota archaeon]|nr:CDP-alcohol phosphatidyltransferase family protein [Candidatus Thermoplasmatota archaeon]MBS3790703.1 CDP-alcohol phosphatidyltransferase family protein [Candidatus Thermoplasmatota archaeon]